MLNLLRSTIASSPPTAVSGYSGDLSHIGFPKEIKDYLSD